jgi:hypothetical protein
MLLRRSSVRAFLARDFLQFGFYRTSGDTMGFFRNLSPRIRMLLTLPVDAS